MSKTTVLEVGVPTKADIMAKIDDLTVSVRAYFSVFEKSTSGQQQMGESSLKFAEDCDKQANIFPEVLPGTHDKGDAQLKLSGARDFFAMKNKVMEAVGEWDVSAKICKSDAMYYANKFYGAIQEEAKENVKYQPTRDELKAFYKKTFNEKKAVEKGSEKGLASPN